MKTSAILGEAIVPEGYSYVRIDNIIQEDEYVLMANGIVKQYKMTFESEYLWIIVRKYREKII